MSIKLIREPFNHIINDSFFTEEEYSKVWDEMMFIAPKMSGDTESAIYDNIPLKRGYGIFLSKVFTHPDLSNIVKATRKISQGIYNELLMMGDSYFNLEGLFKFYNSETILLQMYKNGDYYKPHTDEPLFTHIIALHKKPKPFTGGQLNFPQYDYMVDLSNNQSILFPSWITHEVKQVKLNSESLEDSRFTITNFMYYNYKNQLDGDINRQK